MDVMIAVRETGVMRIGTGIGIGIVVDGEMKGGRGGTMMSGEGRRMIVGGIEIGIMGGTEIGNGKRRLREKEIEMEITGGTKIGRGIDMIVNATMPETGIGGAIVLDAKESVMTETETMSEMRSEEETRGIGIGKERRKEGSDGTETDCSTISIACEASKLSYTVR